MLRNIVSGGPSIIRKPGAYRSNLELTNSLRSNFLAAQQEYAHANGVANANGNGNGNANGNGNGNSNGTRHEHGGGGGGRPAMSVWTRRDGRILYIPRIDWAAAGLQEEPSQYDITVKLFFLPTAPVTARAQYTREALDLVFQELKVAHIDLLIVSFPGMSFEGDCEWEADKINAVQGNDEEEAASWKAVETYYYQGLVKSLGVAEFGSEKLARFVRRVSVRPAVDQINIKNCCNVPPPLDKLAKEQKHRAPGAH